MSNRTVIKKILIVKNYEIRKKNIQFFKLVQFKIYIKKIVYIIEMR